MRCPRHQTVRVDEFAAIRSNLQLTLPDQLILSLNDYSRVTFVVLRAAFMAIVLDVRFLTRATVHTTQDGLELDTFWLLCAQ